MVSSPDNSINFSTIQDHFNNFQEHGGDDFLQYLRQNTTDQDITCMRELDQGTEEWYKARTGRITASNADAVRSLRDIKKSKTLMNSIMGTKDIVKTKRTQHGIDNEQFAREMYRVDQTQKHDGLCVTETGLIVSKSDPYTGASPDGLVSCSCCPDRVLEIKCPYDARDEYPEEIPKKFPDYHLQLDENGDLKLKEKSAWYSQVTFQMGIMGLTKCHLVVHTQKETAVIPISFDADRWELLKRKARQVFVQGVIPQLLKHVN